MSLIQWQCLSTLEHLHQQIHNTLRVLLDHCCESAVWIGSNGTAWISDIKIYETDTDVVLQVEIPIAQLKQLEVQVSPEVAIIQGQPLTDEVEGFFSPGQFRNIIPLPLSVHPEAVEATVNGNQLTLTLPKSGQTALKHITVALGTSVSIDRQEAVEAKSYTL